MILPGNASCHGCPITIAMKTLDEIENPVVLMPASCSTVIAGIHPNSALKLTVVHVPFPSTPSVAAGMSRGYRKLGIKANVIAWMGDGAADISFTALKAIAERNEDVMVVIVDNEAFMNTGNQSSSSTPKYAKTTTDPAGKRENRRSVSLSLINYGYVATASVGYVKDLRRKMRKAGEKDGFRLLHIHCPCPPGWKFEAGLTVEIARLAVQSLFWILWEKDNKLRISEISKKAYENRIPAEKYIKLQGRFKGIKREEIEELEKFAVEEFERLLKLEEIL